MHETIQESRPASPLDGADLELLRLIGRGLPVDAVARRLDVSGRTVRRRCTRICRKLGVTTPIESVVWAAWRHLL